jgi:hypothetical protein
MHLECSCLIRLKIIFRLDKAHKNNISFIEHYYIIKPN